LVSVVFELDFESLSVVDFEPSDVVFEVFDDDDSLVLELELELSFEPDELELELSFDCVLLDELDELDFAFASFD